MTNIYFVRHAQPDHDWADDRTRPLSEEGEADSEEVWKTLEHVPLDYAVSSPYVRSVKTIETCAARHGLTIHCDERYRERDHRKGSNNSEMFRKRWNDLSFHEEGGESLRMVQERNIEALTELLDARPDGRILFGTHGTALSTILNYYEPTFGCDDFLRIINYMPYIIRLDFEGRTCVGKEELLIIEKEYKGNPVNR